MKLLIQMIVFIQIQMKVVNRLLKEKLIILKLYQNLEYKNIVKKKNLQKNLPKMKVKFKVMKVMILK